MIPFVLLAFILNPLAGILLCAYYCWIHDSRKNSQLLVLGLMISMFLGLLNTTKNLTGDMIEYREYFLNVPKYSNIIDYLVRFGKEPLYYGYTYLSYYIYGGSWPLFIFSITTANYMLLSYSIIKVGEKIKSNAPNIVCTLFFLLFSFKNLQVALI